MAELSFLAFCPLSTSCIRGKAWKLKWAWAEGRQILPALPQTAVLTHPKQHPDPAGEVQIVALKERPGRTDRD